MSHYGRRHLNSRQEKKREKTNKHVHYMQEKVLELFLQVTKHVVDTEVEDFLVLVQRSPDEVAYSLVRAK